MDTCSWTQSLIAVFPKLASEGFEIVGEPTTEYNCIAYELCGDGGLEEGYLKVALYVDEGKFQHAAAQMPNGAWRSKMGEGPVIEHRSPESLAGRMYGEVHCFMRRPV